MTENEEKTYTCNDYRKEMILLGLLRRLNNPALSKAEKDAVIGEIQELEKAVGLD